MTASAHPDGTFPHTRSRSTRFLSATGVLLLSCITAGCQWFAVSYHALGYPATAGGEIANVAVTGTTAYGTLAEEGFLVRDLSDGTEERVVPPAAGSGSVDDLAVADSLLFVLDAREPGYLSVYSLSDPGNPRLVSGPVPAMVGPFSGVSAGGGNVVVSGGTARMSLHTYDAAGRLAPETATIDLGRGQPDVLVSPDGRSAFVSTHYFGPSFGITTVVITPDTPSFRKVGELGLDTYGFTAGGAKPASFPIEGALAGEVLYVAHARGLAVISLQRLDQPRILTVMELGIEAVNVDARDNLAAVVGSSPSPRLVLLDISRPESPVITETVALPDGTRPTAVSIGRGHIVVATHRRDLIIINHKPRSS